jgi:hypothetical protein
MQGSKGRALLFLIPEELGFLRYLKEARVPLNEYEYPKAKVANVQVRSCTRVHQCFPNLLCVCSPDMDRLQS